jgi:transposase InsO family protein
MTLRPALVDPQDGPMTGNRGGPIPLAKPAATWSHAAGKRQASIAKLRSATFAWIEGWYNLRRRHSSLGGMSPANYEKIRPPAATQAA